jgi:hypothetical protein
MTNAAMQTANPPANVKWRRRASDPVSRVGSTAERNSLSGSDETTAHTLVTPVSALECARKNPGNSQDGAAVCGYYAFRGWGAL